MSVHFKFKSSTTFDSVQFDGAHISVGDLKRAIVAKKKLGHTADFDLKFTNAQSGEGSLLLPNRAVCFLSLSYS